MILSSPRSKRKLLVSEMLAIEVKRDALERELKQDDGGADSGNSGISLTEEQKVYLRRARYLIKCIMHLLNELGSKRSLTEWMCNMTGRQKRSRVKIMRLDIIQGAVRGWITRDATKEVLELGKVRKDTLRDVRGEQQIRSRYHEMVFEDELGSTGERLKGREEAEAHDSAPTQREDRPVGGLTSSEIKYEKMRLKFIQVACKKVIVVRDELLYVYIESMMQWCIATWHHSAMKAVDQERMEVQKIRETYGIGGIKSGMGATETSLMIPHRRHTGTLGDRVEFWENGSQKDTLRSCPPAWHPPSLSEGRRGQLSLSEGRRGQPSLSEGRRGQPSLSEGSRGQPSLSEGRRGQPSLSEGRRGQRNAIGRIDAFILGTLERRQVKTILKLRDEFSKDAPEDGSTPGRKTGIKPAPGPGHAPSRPSPAPVGAGVKRGGTVFVTVREAKGLADKDTFKKSDPYVVLKTSQQQRMGGSKRVESAGEGCDLEQEEGDLLRTKTVDNDLNPVWNESFEIPVILASTVNTVNAEAGSGESSVKPTSPQNSSFLCFFNDFKPTYLAEHPASKMDDVEKAAQLQWKTLDTEAKAQYMYVAKNDYSACQSEVNLSSADISSRNSKYWHKQRNGIKNIALQKALASKEEESKMYEKKMKLAHVPVPEKISVTHLEPIDSIDMTQRLAFWNDMQKVERAQHATEMAQHASIVDAEEAHGAAMALQNHREKIESMPNGHAKEAEMKAFSNEETRLSKIESDLAEREYHANQSIVAAKEADDAVMGLQNHRHEIESMPNGPAKEAEMETLAEEEVQVLARIEHAQHAMELVVAAEEVHDAAMALQNHREKIESMPNGPAKEAEMELLAHEKVHVAAKVERAQRATEMMVATKEVHDAAMALKIHRQETESMPNGHAKDVTMEMMVEKEEVMSAKKERAQHVAESMHFAKEAADATQALRRVQGTIRGLQARHMVAVLHDCRGEGHRMLGRSGRWLTI